MNSKVIAIVAVVVALGVICGARDIQSDPPGGIRLLPGYQHRRVQSIDDVIGEIWKDRGLKIYYDIGTASGNPDEHYQVRELWRKELTVSGQRVVCVLNARKSLTIYIENGRPNDKAIFQATVKTPEQQADMLLMVLTYRNPAVQNPSSKLRTGTLVKREMSNGADNYAYATYSFKSGGNGAEVQKLCRNNWELIFGNSPVPDSFDVTTVTDDRSRILDLGDHNWDDNFEIPNLPAYEKPQREPSVKAIAGHVYLVHSRHTDTDLYTLFRVEKLVPGVRVDITWKLIPAP